MPEEKFKAGKLIDENIKENVIKELLQCVKKEVENDLEVGSNLIKNFDQSKVNDYMKSLKFKYMFINGIYILLKYGPSLNNNVNTTNYNYSKIDLYDQVCVVNMIKQTLDIKDEVDKYNKLIELLKNFINNYNNSINNSNNIN